MPRIRTIKPSFFLNEELADLDHMDRLIWIGLWTQADRSGRLEDRPRRLKAVILPFDPCDMDRALDRLASKGFVIRYQVGEEFYLQVVNFEKHQRPRTDEEPSVIPSPEDGITRENRETFSSLDSEDHSSQESLGKEKGKGEGSTPLTPRWRGGTHRWSPTFLERFWPAYPRKVAKPKALRAWEKLQPDDALVEEMLVALEQQKHSTQWTKDGGEFIPHPSTWLNQRRWEDQLEPEVKANEHASRADQRRHAESQRLGANTWQCPHDPPCAGIVSCKGRILDERRRA